jgi:hypothetical protein
VNEQFLDDLAKGLGNGNVPRRRALKLIGGALLAAMVPTLFPRHADASSRAKRRCRRMGGLYLSKGNCHCTSTCGTSVADFHCHNNTDCFCSQTLEEGKGFCSQLGTFTNCATAVDCPIGQSCIIRPECVSNEGKPCSSSAQCATGAVCVRGFCMFTLCAAPCPT